MTVFSSRIIPFSLTFLPASRSCGQTARSRLRSGFTWVDTGLERDLPVPEPDPRLARRPPNDLPPALEVKLEAPPSLHAQHIPGLRVGGEGALPYGSVPEERFLLAHVDQFRLD